MEVRPVNLHSLICKFRRSLTSDQGASANAAKQHVEANGKGLEDGNSRHCTDHE